MPTFQVFLIVYSAKGLKSKSGKHKYCVHAKIRGSSSPSVQKTNVVEDLFDDPSFNKQFLFAVNDIESELKLKVTEKGNVLGQVIVPLRDLGQVRSENPEKVPLRPHRSCAHPKGELLFDAWIVGDAHTPPPSNQAKSSENLSVVSSGIKKFGGKMSSVLKLNQKDADKKKKGGGWFRGAVSMLDLSNSRSNLAKKETPTHQPSFFKPTTSHTFPAPEVTGLSPKMADSSGGALVVIRGDYLGRDVDDVLHVFICGVDMVSNVKYVSSSKLIVTLLPCTPCSGNVIVETKSGGLGSSTVEFSFVESSAAGFSFDAASLCSNTSSFSFNSRESYQERLVAPNQERLVAPNQDKVGVLNLEKNKWSPTRPGEEEEEGRRSVIQDLPIIEEDYEDISNLFPLNKSSHDDSNDDYVDQTSFTEKLNFYEKNINKPNRNSDLTDYNSTDAYQKKEKNDKKMSFSVVKSLTNDNREIKEHSEISSVSTPRHKLSSAIENDEGWMEIEKKFSDTNAQDALQNRKFNSESTIPTSHAHLAHNNDDNKVTSFKSELKFKASPPQDLDNIYIEQVSKQQLTSQSHQQLPNQNSCLPQSTLSQHSLSNQLHQRKLSQPQHTLSQPQLTLSHQLQQTKPQQQHQQQLDLHSPSRPPPPRIRRYRPTSELHLKTAEDKADHKRRITTSNITLDENILGRSTFEKKIIEIQPLHRDQRLDDVEDIPAVPLRTNHIRSRIEELSRDNDDVSFHRSLNHIPQAPTHSINSKSDHLNNIKQFQPSSKSLHNVTNPPQTNSMNAFHTQSTPPHPSQDSVFSPTGSFRKKIQPNRNFIRALRDEDEVDGFKSTTPPFKPPRVKDILNTNDGGNRDDEVISNGVHKATESNTAIVTASHIIPHHADDHFHFERLKEELDMKDTKLSQLKEENKALEEERNLLRRYIEVLISRALCVCPEILSREDKLCLK